MAIPDYQTLMLPILKIAGDSQLHKFRDVVETLKIEFSLTKDEEKKLLPSGKQAVFDNRVGWAKTYLLKAGLLSSPRRSYFQITEVGINLLQENPPKINVSLLEKFPQFIEFRNKNKDSNKANNILDDSSEKTPQEELEAAYQSLKKTLEEELLLTIKNNPPYFFERLVVDLLIKMGYGGSRKEAGEAIGKTNDEGIDGIIKEDKLGLDIIYIQAKRWDSTVGRPEVQKFAGALQGQRAKKGIFITTSQFSTNAIEFVSNIETKIILVDGKKLAELMIDHGIGVTTQEVYEIKRLDSDYFIEN